ncbi:antibiotic biosynthesis monooxygenase [Roseobacter weihaiensis]|uniref:antibiotic biosynthesis monooxygenase n=1 Tax=Roseobacter weihaiensis TaxID=2763262 RepID=UPI001D0A2212|nr:antibiotic biosynthesis monooxygenase [Roseobacter sp. H9]
MTNPELIITDILEAVPGKEEEVRRKLLAVTDGERRVGPGFTMTRFDLHQNKANPSQFLLYETWKTKSGFDEYHRAHRPPELSSFLEEAGDLLTEAPEDVSQQWEMISVIEDNQAAIAATAFLDALAISDADAIAGMWTEDAVLEFPFAPEGFTECVEGQPAIEKYFRDALAVVVPIGYPNRVITPLADPNACVIEFDSQLTVGDDPTVQENSYITIVRVRNGKIAHFKEHYDSVKRVAGFPSADEVAGDAASAHTVTVNLRARADAADDLAALMRQVRARAAKDAGCQFYRVFRAQADPALFTIFEAWDTEAAFNAHMAAEWVAEVNGKIAALVDGEVAAQSHVEL